MNVRKMIILEIYKRLKYNVYIRIVKNAHTETNISTCVVLLYVRA